MDAVTLYLDQLFLNALEYHRVLHGPRLDDATYRRLEGYRPLVSQVLLEFKVDEMEVPMTRLASVLIDTIACYLDPQYTQQQRDEAIFTVALKGNFLQQILMANYPAQNRAVM